MNKNEPHIQEQPQISKDHQEMISDLQSIVKDLTDLYRNAVLGKKEEKDNDITTIPIKKYNNKQSGNAGITLSIKKDTDSKNNIINDLLGSIKNNIKSNGANSHTKRQEFPDLKDKIKSLTITRDNGDKDILEFGTPTYNREIQNITVCQVEDNKSKKGDKYIVFEYTSKDYEAIKECLKKETTIEEFKELKPMDKFAHYKTRTYKLVIDLTNDVVYNYGQNVGNVIACDLEHSTNLQNKMKTRNLHNHFRNPFFIVQPQITEKEIDKIIKNKQKNENTLPDCNPIDKGSYGEYFGMFSDEILQLNKQDRKIKEELCKNEYLNQHLDKISTYVLNIEQKQKQKEKPNIKGDELCKENLISNLTQVDLSLKIAQQLIKQKEKDGSHYLNDCYEYALRWIQDIIQANTSWTIMETGEFEKFKETKDFERIKNIKQKINAIRGRQEPSHQQSPNLQVGRKKKKGLRWWQHVISCAGFFFPYLYFYKVCCNEPEVLEDLNGARGRGKGRST